MISDSSSCSFCIQVTTQESAFHFKRKAICYLSWPRQSMWKYNTGSPDPTREHGAESNIKQGWRPRELASDPLASGLLWLTILKELQLPSPYLSSRHKLWTPVVWGRSCPNSFCSHGPPPHFSATLHCAQKSTLSKAGGTLSSETAGSSDEPHWCSPALHRGLDAFEGQILQEKKEEERRISEMT